MTTRTTESRTERITVRWPTEVDTMLKLRAKARMRSISAEVRELLTYARNSISDTQMISLGSYSTERSTSVSITPRLRHWLSTRAQYNDRSIQVELLALVSYSLDDIMERDLQALSEIPHTDPEAPAPE